MNIFSRGKSNPMILVGRSSMNESVKETSEIMRKVKVITNLCSGVWEQICWKRRRRRIAAASSHLACFWWKIMQQKWPRDELGKVSVIFRRAGRRIRPRERSTKQFISLFILNELPGFSFYCSSLFFPSIFYLIYVCYWFS